MTRLHFVEHRRALASASALALMVLVACSKVSDGDEQPPDIHSVATGGPEKPHTPPDSDTVIVVPDPSGKTKKLGEQLGPDRVGGKTGKPEPVPLPPVLPVASASVVVMAQPAGALVRVLDAEGKVVGEAQSPGTLRIPPGSYAWEVSAAGFMTDHSGPTGFVAIGGEADTIRTTLQRADQKVVLDQANKRFADRQCSEAISLYEQLEAPANLSGAGGGEWARSRLRMAQCAMAIGKTPAALDAIDNARSARPNDWYLRYMQGTLLCRAEQYVQGASRLRDMRTNGITELNSEDRFIAILMSKYALAECDRLQFERGGSTNESLRERMLTSYQEFSDGAARRASTMSMPPELKREFDEARSKAQAMLEKAKPTGDSHTQSPPTNTRNR